MSQSSIEPWIWERRKSGNLDNLIDEKGNSIIWAGEYAGASWIEVGENMEGNLSLIEAAPVMFGALKSIEEAALKGYLTPELCAAIVISALKIAEK